MTSASAPIAVFPGQGSQHVGMAKDLYENFAVARQVFEEASDSIRVNLKKLCFEGPDSDLVLTENTQPCLLTASVAAFRVAEKELDFVAKATAGHSLGEYSALVASGSLELSTAVRWVKERGKAMQLAVPSGVGAMAAILNVEDSMVERLCEAATQAALGERDPSGDSSVETLVEPANFNAPGQVVIAGSTDAVQKAISLLKTDSSFGGGKAILLQVSAPFHCRLMRSARERMAEVFSKTETSQQPKAPRFPYVPNRTARLTREPGLVLELLVEQIDHPVLWKQSILTFLGNSVQDSSERFVEFGPGKVLCGLIKRISSQAGKTCLSTSVGDTQSLNTLQTFLKTQQ